MFSCSISLHWRMKRLIVDCEIFSKICPFRRYANIIATHFFFHSNFCLTTSCPADQFLEKTNMTKFAKRRHIKQAPLHFLSPLNCEMQWVRKERMKKSLAFQQQAAVAQLIRDNLGRRTIYEWHLSENNYQNNGLGWDKPFCSQQVQLRREKREGFLDLMWIASQTTR